MIMLLILCLPLCGLILKATHMRNKT